MYEVGALLVYDTTGVCRVDDIGIPEGMSLQDKTRKYYKLSPVFGSGTIYIPVDTKVFMRPVISREEAETLIRKIPEIQEEDTCDIHNQKVLEDHYKASIHTHECEDLVQLIKTVYAKKRKLEQRGKKTGKMDQQYMKRAKELLHGELAVALEIPIDDVEGYISGVLARQG